mgnify:CR=1 FL=1
MRRFASPYPGYRHATPKPRVLSAELHPDIHFPAMIPRRGGKSKTFLSVVIYVVKPAFMPLSTIVKSPANTGVTRLCDGSHCPAPDTATALPNQARYQLRYTRIKICRPHPGGISTIPAFFLACKGKICLGAFCIPGPFPPRRITAPAPPSGRPPDRSFPRPRQGPPGPYGRRPPAYDRWAFADPDRG